jgi:hypothetical protein
MIVEIRVWMENCDEEGDDKNKSKLVYHVVVSLSTR